MKLGHREAVALRKLGEPAGFQFYQLEFIGTDAVKLTGCIVTRTYSRGPRKGKPVFDGERLVAVVTAGEEEIERARFEAETGQCGECMGEGKTLKAWRQETGAEWRPCRSCGGTGVVQKALA